MKEDALVQFKLLLPAALKARVEARASENRRSLSQEIVAALELVFPDPSKPTPKGTTFDPLNKLTFEQEKAMVLELLSVLRKHGIDSE